MHTFIEWKWYLQSPAVLRSCKLDYIGSSNSILCPWILAKTLIKYFLNIRGLKTYLRKLLIFSLVTCTLVYNFPFNLSITMHFSVPLCFEQTRNKYLTLCKKNQESLCITTCGSIFSEKHFFGGMCFYNAYLSLCWRWRHPITLHKEIRFWRLVGLGINVCLVRKRCSKRWREHKTFHGSSWSCFPPVDILKKVTSLAGYHQYAHISIEKARD